MELKSGDPIEVRMKDGRWFSGTFKKEEGIFLYIDDILKGPMKINTVDMQFHARRSQKYINDKQKAKM